MTKIPSGAPGRRVGTGARWEGLLQGRGVNLRGGGSHRTGPQGTWIASPPSHHVPTPGNHWAALCPSAGLPCGWNPPPSSPALWEWRPALPHGFRVRPSGASQSFAAFRGRVTPSLPKRQPLGKQTSELVNGLSAEELEGLGPRPQLLRAVLEHRAAGGGEGVGQGQGRGRRRGSANGSFRWAVSSGGLLGSEEESACGDAGAAPPSRSRSNTCACKNPERAHHVRQSDVSHTSLEGAGHGGGARARLRASLVFLCAAQRSVFKAGSASPLPPSLPSEPLAAARCPPRAASAALACSALIFELVRGVPDGTLRFLPKSEGCVCPVLPRDLLCPSASKDVILFKLRNPAVCR